MKGIILNLTLSKVLWRKEFGKLIKIWNMIDKWLKVTEKIRRYRIGWKKKVLKLSPRKLKSNLNFETITNSFLGKYFLYSHLVQERFACPANFKSEVFYKQFQMFHIYLKPIFIYRNLFFKKSSRKSCKNGVIRNVDSSMQCERRSSYCKSVALV